MLKQDFQVRTEAELHSAVRQDGKRPPAGTTKTSDYKMAFPILGGTDHR
jgi:hypothetical protein